jgi:ubiquinone/menaquinone biosynthesis C-methylase UbiE
MGTGSGVVAIALAKKGYKVTGLDRAYAMIDMAKLTAQEQKADVEFLEADAECTGLDDCSFDAIVLRNVVWNSFHPDNILKEAERLLKKGGSIIITDGNWQTDIGSWENANPNSEVFPNFKKRDLGLGAYDVINVYYSKLPLNSEARPEWDNRNLKSDGLSVEVCEKFDDPMITEDIKPILKSGFIVVAKK